MSPALPAMDVAARVDRLRAQLGDNGCDALLVTHLVNVRYLTGFTGSAAIVLLTADGLLFVTDGRYGDQAVEQLTAAGLSAADAQKALAVQPLPVTTVQSDQDTARRVLATVIIVFFFAQRHLVAGLTAGGTKG